MVRLLKDVVPAVLTIGATFWLACGVGLFVMNPAFLFRWSYDVAWFILFGAPSTIALYISFRLKRRFSKLGSQKEDLSVARRRAWEHKTGVNSWRTSRKTEEAPETGFTKERDVWVTREEMSQRRREDEFMNDFYLEHNHLKQSYDVHEHISSYVTTCGQRALEPEMFKSFIRLLERKNIMSEYDYPDIKDLVDTELRSVQAKKSEQRKRKAKEARRAGLLGADRASTW